MNDIAVLRTIAYLLAAVHDTLFNKMPMRSLLLFTLVLRPRMGAAVAAAVAAGSERCSHAAPSLPLSQLLAQGCT